MNNVTKHISKHLHDVFFGGNWTCANLRDSLKDVSLAEAQKTIGNCNSILVLVCHIQYFIKVANRMLTENILEGKDSESFDTPNLENDNDWQQFLESNWKETTLFIGEIEKLSDEQMWEVFGNEKYGNYFRNLTGIIEHTHYHLGQINLVKKQIKSDWK